MIRVETVPVVFVNRGGVRLFGILDLPVGRRRETGVVFLNPGIKNRVGPHRMYVKMARRFTEMGFSVLRFDAHGLGDSEGGNGNEILEDFFGTVERGKFVGDVAAALGWLEREIRIRGFVLAGLCGGAITGLLAGAEDPRVRGLLGIGMPVILNGSSIDPVANLPNEALASYRRMYLGRITKVRSWVRFFMLRSNYRVLFKSLIVWNPFGRRSTADAQSGENSASGGRDNTNPLFAPALHRMLEDRKRVLLIFGGADHLYFEFKEKYLQRHSERLKPFGDFFTLIEVDQANHLFTFKRWQEHLFETAAMWLRAFP